MIDLRFRPISDWPGIRRSPRDQKDGSKVFSADYNTTLNSLEREMRYLHAKSIVIEADFHVDQIRNDGWPYSSATPKSSGVILSFSSQHGPLRIPCDYFRGWQHNLRAISLHLERLRLATNYGVGQFGEQYTGWKQLAAPAQMSASGAAAIVAQIAEIPDNADDILTDQEAFETAYRMAAKVAHPDTGGKREHWDRLQEARAVLASHFSKRATA